MDIHIVFKYPAFPLPLLRDQNTALCLVRGVVPVFLPSDSIGLPPYINRYQKLISTHYLVMLKFLMNNLN